jgi:hypothetical protein
MSRLAERPTEPTIAPLVSMTTAFGAWITTCGMSLKSTRPTPRTQTVGLSPRAAWQSRIRWLSPPSITVDPPD